MIRHDAVDAATGMPPEQSFSWREELIVRALAKSLSGPHIVGRLRVRLPSGRTEVFGHHGCEAIVSLPSFEPLWRGLTRGALGITESYLDGKVVTPDLKAVLEFCLVNTKAVAAVGSGVMRPGILDKLWHRSRANSRSGSRRNIAAHYDLGNDFYKLWLDPGMTYSSALFERSDQTLADAQARKYQLVFEALRVAPGDRVLEIGCGWGGFAEVLAKANVSVQGLTLSRQQQVYARERLQREGLSSVAEIELVDYRDSKGQFDAIASIEMIEAVGEKNWPTYFKVLHDRLKPGGNACIQSITIDARYYAAYRREPDFIQRYIFPGGMLPTVDIMSDQASAAGLAFEKVETFGASYAQTVSCWLERFDAAWPQIQDLGFDERFRRMWRFYLIYCQVGFASGDIDVGIYRLTRSR
jgi:cyclopropane-fatty-acyl-phospholipid synthase